MSLSPEFTETIEVGVLAALKDVHTAVPGKVTRYDAAKQLVDVQPLIRDWHLDESGERVAVSFPVVTNCPVQFASGGGFSITFPLNPGDIGILLFAEGSLDKWLAGRGGEVDPDIDHRFSLTDGIFIPGIRAFGAPRPTPASALVMGNEGGIRIHVDASAVRLGPDPESLTPLDGVVTGQGVDTFTGTKYALLGSASTKVLAAK